VVGGRAGGVSVASPGDGLMETVVAESGVEVRVGFDLSRAVVKELKDRRRRPEGGEWEPIKIPYRNLTYIPNLTRRPSLLTRLRPHSYE
jgi:hypothetical protein